MRALLAGVAGSQRPRSLQPLHRRGGEGSGMKSRVLGIIAAVVALAADQGSKLYLLYKAGFVHMAPGQAVPVLPFFNLVMVWNPGISYGLFPASSKLGSVALVTLSIIAIGALIYWLWGTTSQSLAIGIGLVI